MLSRAKGRARNTQRALAQRPARPGGRPCLHGAPTEPVHVRVKQRVLGRVRLRGDGTEPNGHVDDIAHRKALGGFEDALQVGRVVGVSIRGGRRHTRQRR